MATKNDMVLSIQTFINKLVNSLKPAISETFTLDADAEKVWTLATHIPELVSKNPLQTQITVYKEIAAGTYQLAPTDLELTLTATQLKAKNIGAAEATFYVTLGKVFKTV